jgi:hypothetical protein
MNGIYSYMEFNGGTQMAWVSFKGASEFSSLQYYATTKGVAITSNNVEKKVQLSAPSYTDNSLCITGFLRPKGPTASGTCTLGSKTTTFTMLPTLFNTLSVGTTLNVMHDVFIAKIPDSQYEMFLTTSGLPHMGGPLLASTHVIYTYAKNAIHIHAERNRDKTWRILIPFPWDAGSTKQVVWSV